MFHKYQLGYYNEDVEIYQPNNNGVKKHQQQKKSRWEEICINIEQYMRDEKPPDNRVQTGKSEKEKSQRETVKISI